MRDGLDIDKYGDKRWYLNGEYHRTDGPAIEHLNGNKYWYLNGINISEEQYLKTNRNIKLELLGL